jgi:hypothetical protein
LKKSIKENIIRLAKENAHAVVNLLDEEVDRAIKIKQEENDDIDTDSILDIYHDAYHLFEASFESFFDKIVSSNTQKKKNSILMLDK